MIVTLSIISSDSHYKLIEEAVINDLSVRYHVSFTNVTVERYWKEHSLTKYKVEIFSAEKTLEKWIMFFREFSSETTMITDSNYLEIAHYATIEDLKETKAEVFCDLYIPVKLVIT